MTLISIVIIGRNEGARLERCLRSVNAMTLEGFTTEVMYVDSGSTDDSLALAQRLGARTIPLNSPRPTAALGRNAGWRAAAGDFVLFLDGDTILHQDFVRLALPQFSAQTAVVWGHRRELHPKATLYNRVLDLDWVYAPGLTEFCGGDALFRLPVLHQVNGFDETLIAGEEPELCRRVLAVGGEILHVDLPMTLHDLAITHFAQYWKRATRAGHAFAEVSTRFAATTNPFWLADARRNRNRALTLVALPLFALVLTAVLRSPWPVLIALALLAALAARTALKANWKSHDKLALVLYGIHSHFQQIPIYVGQLQFHRSRRTGKRTALVEYKS